MYKQNMDMQCRQLIKVLILSDQVFYLSFFFVQAGHSC